MVRRILQYTYQCKDLLGKGNEKSAEEAEKTLGALAGIMRLNRHAHLHDAPAKDDYADSLNAGKNEVREVVHNGQGVIISQCRNSEKTDAEDDGSYAV